MNVASYGIPAPECTGEAAQSRKPAWYLITAEELDQIHDTLLTLGNTETGEGRIRIWELMLLLDTVQDRLA